MIKHKKLIQFSIITIFCALSICLTACTPSDVTKVDFGAILAVRAPIEEEVVIDMTSSVWPFTGLPATDRIAVFNRPLSVKIENSDVSRPQTNIHRADVVYETEIEGGETRFNCIFHSDIPDMVGNIRSARMSDLWVVPQFNAILFYSGGNSEVISLIKKNNVANLSHDGGSDLYFRSNDAYAPHNLFLELNKALKEARSENIPTVEKNIAPLHFEPMESEEGDSTTQSAIQSSIATDYSWKPANKVDIKFSGAVTSSWEWSPTDKLYLRSQNGEPHMEKTTKTQLTSKNVVVMYAKYTTMKIKDPAGSPTYDITLGGTGKAVIFRDGLQIECTWTANETTKPSFTDANGKLIPLDPGNTWFHVLRDDGETAKITVS